MNYDDNGNLVLTGKLGQAVVNNDFRAFTEAQISGKSEEGLTYQDMADFNEFVSEFFRIGEFPDREGDVYCVIIRKVDQAPFGADKGDPSYPYAPSFGHGTLGLEWEFVPMQPFQGYEPAE